MCLTSITQFVENQTNPKPEDPEITENTTLGKQSIGYPETKKLSSRRLSVPAMKNESLINVPLKSETECCISKPCGVGKILGTTGEHETNSSAKYGDPSIGTYSKKRSSDGKGTCRRDEQSANLEEYLVLESEIRSEQIQEKGLMASGLRNKKTLSMKNEKHQNRLTSVENVERMSVDEIKTAPELVTNNRAVPSSTRLSTSSRPQGNENPPKARLSNQRKSLNTSSRFVYPESKQHTQKQVDFI